MKKTLSTGLFLGLVLHLYAQVYFDTAPFYGVMQSYGSGDFGGGVSLMDFNQDGLDDLTFASQEGDSLHFYLNMGGYFTKIPTLVPHAGESKQVIWVDYDNDGDKDLFVTTFKGSNKLYKNIGDLTFEDASLVAGFPEEEAPTYGATFGDINNDGWLDVYVLNRKEVDTYTNWLYLNNGDGTFTDITLSSGTSDGYRPSFTAAFLDVNEDGWPDLYVANDYYTGNALYLNNGDLTFSDVSETSGAGVHMEAMNVGPGDYDNDGDIDIYVTNSVLQGNRLLRNDGGSFEDVTASAGVACHKFCWAGNFFDCDNDLDLDIYVSSVLVGAGNHNVLYLNDGAGSFTEPYPAGFPGDDQRSYSNAIGDLNNDGYLDIVVSQITPHFHKLWESYPLNSSNWLKLRLEGVQSNRDGIGSRIEVYKDSQMWLRTTHCGEGYLTQNSGTVHFGLADYTSVDSIRIIWPSGLVDKLIDVEANQVLDIVEGVTITNVSEIKDTPFEWQLFPNPVKEGETLAVKIQVPEKLDITLECYDPLGRQIFTQSSTLQKGEQLVYLKLDQSMSGIYYIKIKTGTYQAAQSFLVSHD